MSGPTFDPELSAPDNVFAGIDRLVQLGLELESDSGPIYNASRKIDFAGPAGRARVWQEKAQWDLQLQPKGWRSPWWLGEIRAAIHNWPLWFERPVTREFQADQPLPVQLPSGVTWPDSISEVFEWAEGPNREVELLDRVLARPTEEETDTQEFRWHRSAAPNRLPLTYQHCRSIFHRAARDRGVEIEHHPLSVSDRYRVQLGIDVVRLGDRSAHTILTVLSGVHGVEGFYGSALQSAMLSGPDAFEPPAGTAVVIVHVVNPWGMSHHRRQNKNNVDLNRNFGRDHFEPVDNAAYQELHAIACPASETMPNDDQMIADATPLLEEHGYEWISDGLTRGQYSHADGIQFGGDRTEASNLALERITDAHLSEAERVLVVDLHTGHGLWGTITHLAACAPDSEQARFLEGVFNADPEQPTKIVATGVGHDGADRAVTRTTSGPLETDIRPKSGQIAPGICNRLAARFGIHHAYATTVEVGAADDLTQVGRTYQESWVHRHGKPLSHDGLTASWRYRCALTPDDPAWEELAISGGQAQLHAAQRWLGDMSSIGRPSSGSI